MGGGGDLQAVHPASHLVGEQEEKSRQQSRGGHLLLSRGLQLQEQDGDSGLPHKQCCTQGARRASDAPPPHRADTSHRRNLRPSVQHSHGHQLDRTSPDRQSEAGADREPEGGLEQLRAKAARKSFTAGLSHLLPSKLLELRYLDLVQILLAQSANPSKEVHIPKSHPLLLCRASLHTIFLQMKI